MKALLRIMLVGMALVLFAEMALAVQVRGSRSCGIWVKDREEGRRTGRRLDSTLNSTWLVGYFSGVAFGAGKEFWGKPNANSLDKESVFLWMDNYCRANPLKDIDDGAVELFLERTRAK